MDLCLCKSSSSAILHMSETRWLSVDIGNHQVTIDLPRPRKKGKLRMCDVISKEDRQFKKSETSQISPQSQLTLRSKLFTTISQSNSDISETSTRRDNHSTYNSDHSLTFYETKSAQTDRVLQPHDLVICPYCPKRLVYASLALHLVGHTTESEHKCNSCDFSVNKRWMLDCHTEVHASQPLIPAYTLCESQVESVFLSEAFKTAHRNMLYAAEKSLEKEEQTAPTARKTTNRTAVLAKSKAEEQYIVLPGDKTNAVNSVEFFNSIVCGGDEM